MAWLEKIDDDDTRHVCVVEQRGRTVWERLARGKSPGRGRTRLVGEYSDETAAQAAYCARIAERQADGYSIVDHNAGVDASHPRAVAQSGEKSAPHPKLSVDEFLRLLSSHLAELPEAPSLARALEALDRTMSSGKRAFRARGYACDLTVRGHARTVLKIASADDYWREIGWAADLAVPEERETEEECIYSDAGSWSGFVQMLRADPAWQAVRDLPCLSLALVDDEID